MTIQAIQSEPFIQVGICSKDLLYFSLDESYRWKNHSLQAGRYQASKGSVGIRIESADGKLVGEETNWLIENRSSEAVFQLEEVCIGIDFHWQRHQTQCFHGKLSLRLDESGRILAINEILLEDYLYSVIASEMSAQASVELLKAHAIISRSWLLAQLHLPHRSAPCCFDNEKEHIRWYEREAHHLFDVCADDHCQRYQGISRSGTPQVAEALNSTKAMVLCHEDDICDARFYKCCGGVTESFENCWDNQPKPYLRPVADDLAGCFEADLSSEEAARQFIDHPPHSFCHTQDQAVLQQVLNDYDQESTDFFRWEVAYDAEELSAIVRQRSGIDFGRIQSLEVVERSRSGRIVRLRIVGSLRSLIVGKELEIRKWLSRSHLYSSFFVVDRLASDSSDSVRFLLKGAGWGHGVGLCQIGAAMMAHQGMSYEDILKHYYPGTRLVKLY